MVELTGEVIPIEIAPGYFLSAPGLIGQAEEISELVKKSPREARELLGARSRG